MEDIRNAWEIVTSIATRIAKLNANIPFRPPSSAGRTSTSSEAPSFSSMKSPLLKTPPRISSLGRNSKKPPKIISRTGSDGAVDEVRAFIRTVAREIGADPTTLTVFMSSTEIQQLAREFLSDNKDRCEKPGYTADSIFWNLQYIEQGDEDERRWSRSKPSKDGWEISDHLTRFILLSDKSRLRVKDYRWHTRDMSFEHKVNFYLCILRCFAFRARYLQP